VSSKEIKYHYDQEEGIFVKESDLSVNWLLSQVFQLPDLQITKISNEELQKFLYLLDQSNLRMPDGKHSLIWIKDNLKEKLEMSKAQLGKSWERVTDRYRFILQQIDLILTMSPDREEKLKIILAEEKKDPGITKNNLECFFERKEDIEKENNDI
jgi:hypothetical protein